MQSAKNTPIQISSRIAKEIALEYFGLSGEITKMTGEVDFNFKIKVSDTEIYLLKISRPEEVLENLDFQEAIMDFLGAKSLPFKVPKLVPGLDNQVKYRYEDEDGKLRWVRLQSWVPGRLIDTVSPKNATLLQHWGATAGQLSKALIGFDHPYAHRIFRWDPIRVQAIEKLLPYLASDQERSTANYYLELFRSRVLPAVDQLRNSVNYNDAHELNLLVEEKAVNPKVCGVIDFGDAVYTVTINELAIAAAYALMEHNDPIAALRHLVEAYHAAFPLEEIEARVLFPLICSRLLITVSYAAFNRVREPENAYLSISEQNAWALLNKFRNYDPSFIEYSIRAACGWEPCPKASLFNQWAEKTQLDFHDIVPLKNKKSIALDLDVGGLVLGNNSNFDSAEAMERTIFRYMEDQGAQVGIGGYLETRPFYTTDAYQLEGMDGPQWRTVHIGMDFWDQAGTSIFSPLDGIIHSFQDNAADCDYGPTIILEHRVSPELTFYTLYGHLSRTSLEGLKVGAQVLAGTPIAEIGPAPENGNWAPHLHFQVMLDLLGKRGDFPGVAYPHELDVWESICPNPIHLVPAIRDMQFGRKIDENNTLLDKRKKYLGKSLSISYEKPLQMVRGFGPYLYDTTARRYLDTVNNVAHVGHEHPKVVAAAQHQMGLLNTNTRYLNAGLQDYAESLLARFPDELSVVHFVNSGSEANELALRMAETWSGTRNMVAVEVGYHGNTGRTIDVSSYKFDGKGGKGAPPQTKIIPLPDVYRGRHQDPASAAADYTKYIAESIEVFKQKGEKTGGFIAESILSCGGQIELPNGYLKQAYQIIRASGGLCIADEVQVGFGRVGSHFWGFETQDVIPDIVTLGKPIGNGHPLGAVVCTQAVAEAFANGMEFFNTFGGNPVSCAIGQSVLSVIEEEQLQANALEVGNFLKEGLQALQQNHSIIGDVRGQGLFLGFELVKDLEKKTPAPEAASYLSNRMRQLGVLMSTDGPDHNVLKIKPPMCFSKTNSTFLLEYLDKILKEDFIKAQQLQ